MADDRRLDSCNSSWTKEAIIKYVDERFDTLEKHTIERDNFTKELLAEKINANKELAALALHDAREAVNKAEALTNLKFEVSNNVKEDVGKRVDDLRTYVDRQIGAGAGKAEIKQTASDWRVWLLFIIVIVGFVIDIFLGR